MSRAKVWLLTVTATIIITGVARQGLAQSFERMPLDTWIGNDLAETYDHPIIETNGHANSTPQGTNDSQVVWWDSFGRVRLNRKDADSPFIPYRVLTIDAGTNSRYIRSSMNEIDSGIGLHLGTVAGWKLSTVLGAGFSTTRGFVNANGIFGIGTIMGEHKINDNNSLLLSIDYSGNDGFLPDIPLPGFGIIHHSKYFDLMFGYPISTATVRPIKPLEITASYQVPYQFDIDAEYRVVPHFGFYADTGNFFQGFVTAHQAGTPDGDITNRQFYQMRRAELGMRFIFQPLVDGSIGIGYAFDQGFSRGFDIRDMQPIGHISNEPYLAIMLRGRF